MVGSKYSIRRRGISEQVEEASRKTAIHKENFASQFCSAPFQIGFLNRSELYYYLHRDVLVARCPYFASFFSFMPVSDGDAKDAVELQLCDKVVDGFPAVVDCLYTGSYASYETRPQKFLLHTQVYVIADELQMLSLRKYALESLRKELSNDTYSTFDENPSIPPAIILTMLSIAYDIDNSSDESPNINERTLPNASTQTREPTAQGHSSDGADSACDENDTDALTMLNDPRRDLQMLLAKFTASRHTQYYRIKQYKLYVLQGGQYLEDMLAELQNGSRISTLF